MAAVRWIHTGGAGNEAGGSTEALALN